MRASFAISAAAVSSPVGPLVGSVVYGLVGFPVRYWLVLKDNAWKRELGHRMVDPTMLDFLFSDTLPVILIILFFGTIFALIVNVVIGIPTLLLSERIFRRHHLASLIALITVGGLLGGSIWTGMLSPFTPFNFIDDWPGVVIGGASALAMTLSARKMTVQYEQHSYHA